MFQISSVGENITGNTTKLNKKKKSQNTQQQQL